jgi:hypothetical protein
MGPCYFPVLLKQSVFLVGGIVSNRATIANFKPTLSRKIVDLSGQITLLDNHSPPAARSARNGISLRLSSNWTDQLRPPLTSPNKVGRILSPFVAWEVF